MRPRLKGVPPEFEEDSEKGKARLEKPALLTVNLVQLRHNRQPTSTPP
ncbi:MAG TPA: hypothetical protein VI935_05120 [Thermodesulfobacteriota bacterium]|nr:hypothetical protein [Thermodesulfobacteriota bacterium]